MSFAGHVYDMIRRDKENRKSLSLLHDRSADIRMKYTSSMPDATVEELDEIDRQIKEREAKEQRYILRIKLIVLCTAIASALLFWAILEIV